MFLFLLVVALIFLFGFAWADYALKYPKRTMVVWPALAVIFFGAFAFPLVLGVILPEYAHWSALISAVGITLGGAVRFLGFPFEKDYRRLAVYCAECRLRALGNTASYDLRGKLYDYLAEASSLDNHDVDDLSWGVVKSYLSQERLLQLTPHQAERLMEQCAHFPDKMKRTRKPRWLSQLGV